MLSLSDMGKYPFTKEAQEYRQSRQSFLSEEDLEKPELTSLTFRAKNRVIQSLQRGIETSPDMDPEIEIWSFSVAMYLVKAVGDTYLEKRYALAESKRAKEFLKSESKEKLYEITTNTFGWNIREENIIYGEQYDFALHFTIYLRNASSFQDDKWKLVNRTLINSYVYLTKEEVARLLEEEIRKFIESRLASVEKVPQSIGTLTGEIKQHLAAIRKEIVFEELPKNVVASAYPPCIKRLYDLAVSGQHLSHLGRFALTSFLLNIGMSVDEVVKLFPNQSDFSENLTRYQVEHIAGKRGSKVRYKPPNCDTLRTHGLCILRIEECKDIKNPLIYYKRKMRAFR